MHDGVEGRDVGIDPDRVQNFLRQKRADQRLLVVGDRSPRDLHVGVRVFVPRTPRCPCRAAGSAAFRVGRAIEKLDVNRVRELRNHPA